MKVLKRISLIFVLILSLGVLFCFTASAEDIWRPTIFNDNVHYMIEENTGTTIIKALDNSKDSNITATTLGSSPLRNVDDMFEVYEGSWSDYLEVYNDYPYIKDDMLNTKTLIIDGSIDSLSPVCFQFLKNVEVIILPENITEIPDGAFLGLSKLNAVVLSDKTKSIGKCAFYGCAGLKSLYIPESVESIGDYAFYSMNSNYIKIPESVKDIGKDLFISNDMTDNFRFNFASSRTSALLSYENDPFGAVSGVEIYNYNENTEKHEKLLTVESIFSPSYICGGEEASVNTDKMNSGGVYNLTFKTWITVGEDTVWSDYSKPYAVSAKPQTVKKLSASQTKNSITLNWERAAANTKTPSYRVFQLVNGKWKALADTADTSYTVKGLASGTGYTFAVRTFISYPKTVWSDTYTKIVTSTALDTPAVSASSASRGRVTVTWKDINGETGYQVWYSLNKSSGYKKASNYSANTKKADVSGLKSGNIYYFRVRAYKSVGGAYVYSSFCPPIAVKVK